MKVPIVRLALIPFLLIVASVACARPTPTRLTVVVPGASPAPLTSPVILSDIPASPLPGRRFRYVTLPAACTAPAVEPSYEAKAGSTASSNPASALHIVSTVDASHDLDASGSESPHAILDTELAEIDPRETVLAASALHPVPPEDGPAQHARFAPEAVDTRTASGDDTAYDESRAVAGRRGTVLAAVPTAVSDAPEPPTAKHPTLPKMIGYSVLLFGASSRLCARVKRTSLINSSSRALHLPLSPLLLEAHRTLHAPAAWTTRPAAYAAALRSHLLVPLRVCSPLRSTAGRQCHRCPGGATTAVVPPVDVGDAGSGRASPAIQRGRPPGLRARARRARRSTARVRRRRPPSHTRGVRDPAAFLSDPYIAIGACDGWALIVLTHSGVYAIACCRFFFVNSRFPVHAAYSVLLPNT